MTELKNTDERHLNIATPQFWVWEQSLDTKHCHLLELIFMAVNVEHLSDIRFHALVPLDKG